MRKQKGKRKWALYDKARYWRIAAYCRRCNARNQLLDEPLRHGAVIGIIVYGPHIARQQGASASSISSRKRLQKYETRRAQRVEIELGILAKKRRRLPICASERHCPNESNPSCGRSHCSYWALLALLLGLACCRHLS
jgi:hypothetical protein